MRPSLSIQLSHLATALVIVACARPQPVPRRPPVSRALQSRYPAAVSSRGPAPPTRWAATWQALLEGTNCLVTHDGVRTASAGESLIVPEGPPMVLTGVGTAVRHTLTLVVHDAAQPWTIPASDWTSNDRCPG